MRQSEAIIRFFATNGDEKLLPSEADLAACEDAALLNYERREAECV